MKTIHRIRINRYSAVFLCLLFTAWTPPAGAARLKDLVDIEGFRNNHLVGIGLVVGLAGTGDSASSAMTRRPLAALAKRLGLRIDANAIKAKNVAAVAITAQLPPYSRPGAKIDVTVSSLGSAKSLQGGTLIATPLKGADLRVYAIAQGALTVGGFAASGSSGSSSSKNHTTVARIPGGAVSERAAPIALPRGRIVLLLRDPDFTTASRITAAINKTLGPGTASVRDPGAVRVKIAGVWTGRMVDLVAAVEAIDAMPDAPARVIINERSGTIVVGAHVTVGPTAIAHGGITIQIKEQLVPSQPGILAKGETVVTPDTAIDVQEQDSQLRVVPEATTVGDVAKGLSALGVKPRDLVAIFQALKAAGALRAEILVL